MTTDRQTGLKRLAIAVAVPWSIWWGYQAWHTQSRIQQYEATRAQWAQRGFSDLGSANALAAMYDRLLAQLAWLLAPFVIAAIAYWVYRGFKPSR